MTDRFLGKIVYYRPRRSELPIGATPSLGDDCSVTVVTVVRAVVLFHRAVLKRVPSAERSVMRSVLQHTKTRAANKMLQLVISVAV